MKFHFALLFVLCAHALARVESIKDWKATAKKSTNAIRKHRLEDVKTKRDSFFRPTTKINALPADAVIVTKKRNGTSMISSCSAGIDEITVGVKRILAKNGVEFVYLPMDTDVLANCFESYNNTILNAPDLISCCDAAAAGGYNSFRFDGSVCKGFKAWLSPIHTQCLGEDHTADGLFVATKKVSKFTPRAPTFDMDAFLGSSRVFLQVTNITDQCPFSKTLKVTTYSKNESTKLEFVDFEDHFVDIYLTELCDDYASAAKRTVTASILDSDGSELASVKKVLSTDIIGHHLTSNGLCMYYDSADAQLNYVSAVTTCLEKGSMLPSGNGILPFTDLLRIINGLKVGANDFWTPANRDGKPPIWKWISTKSPINMSLFNSQSLVDHPNYLNAVVNVTDGLLYAADVKSLHTTFCVDAPYYNLFYDEFIDYYFDYII